MFHDKILLGVQVGGVRLWKDLEILAPWTLDSMFSGITRLEVIEYSADAFTQSLDAHMISKYEGDLKTKNHDRTPTAALYGESWTVNATFFSAPYNNSISMQCGISRKENN